MKDDTISRAAAIDAMMKLQAEDIEAYGASIPEGFDGDRAVTAIKALPPAQLAQDLPKGCTDTISREAAIELVCKEGTRLERNGTVAMAEIKQWCVDLLESLPSAQPERTCVNCGRTVNNGGWYADGGTRCPIEEHYALPKDGFCHLWEKRNVTDDDYPERRTDG